MALADDLQWDSMTDNGMWIWAGVLTAIGLVASWFIAIAWQRWKEKQKADER